MSFANELLPEFDEEMKSTRRVIERMPSEKGEWKPHPKSFSLAHLTQLVAGMPGWITNMLQETSLDLGRQGGYSTETTETLLGVFDKNVREARAAIEATQDRDVLVDWSLRHGDNVLFTAPRKVVIRQTMSHLSHHRGQLTVYLRLLDVPVPSIYGPTADEGWGR
ncbi:MAG TPA: DinB family protein [Longimicrobiales bacterium]